MAAVLFSLAVSVTAAANPCIRRPVVQFIHFYEQSDDMSRVDRLIYSVLMTQTSDPVR
jgi:hypothetical protein